MNDRVSAPTTTPQIEPRPPRMIIARTKIENENCELVGVDRVQVGAEERAGHAAAGGAGRVGEQLDVFTSGTPMLTAATSSSRIAIQARPSRESRRRKLMNTHDQRQPERRPVPGSAGSAW